MNNENSIETLLFIGYDCNDSTNDIPVLSVGIHDPSSNNVVIFNTFYGDKALKLYSYLSTSNKTEPIMEEVFLNDEQQAN